MIQIETDPGAARAQHYDLVCNGWELGSGSIRINRRDLQEKMIAFLRISPAEAERRYGYFLGAVGSGAAPPGGPPGSGRGGGPSATPASSPPSGRRRAPPTR